jgi:NAD(P)-dependent dehydrogenase (short-subunit alcohol dehydrogenase family)
VTAVLRGEGHAAEAHAVDVADRATVEKLAAAAEAGRVDAVIHTAGVISTPMGQAELQSLAGPRIQDMIDQSGAGRAGTPDDIAAATAFLAGPESSFITGNDILVDGGVIAAQRWNTAPRA